jgi:ligand-binding sensor domain-containing protein
MKRSLISRFEGFLCMILLLGSCSLWGQPLRLPFHHLTQDEGLSDTYNSFIHKDSRGFVWLSSIDGLNRFDGQSIKVYRANSADSTAIAGNIVTSNFYEDPAGNLWFTTYGAINCYIRSADHFKSFQVKNEAGKPFTADYYAFHFEAGRLWVRVGIGRSGQLYWLDTETGETKLVGPLDGQRTVVRTVEKGRRYQLLSYIFFRNSGVVYTNIEDGKIVEQGPLFQQESDRWLAKQNVSFLKVAADTSWWIGIEKGFVNYNPQQATARRWSTWKGEDLGPVNGIIPLDENQLLIGAGAAKDQIGGIWLFDETAGEMRQRFRTDTEDPFALKRDFVNGLYLDDTDVLWISMWTVGVDFASLHKSKFDILLDGNVDPTTKADVTAVCQDTAGQIWCGTYRQGIFIYDENRQLKTRLWDSEGFVPSRKRVDGLLADQSGNIWVGARRALYRYSAATAQPMKPWSFLPACAVCASFRTVRSC